MLALVFVFLLTLTPITFANDHHGFRATLTGIRHNPGGYSAAVRRDTRRLALLSYAAFGAATATATITNSTPLSLKTLAENSAGSYSYHMNLSIGTPPLTFSAMVDTGSDLVWTQCAPCTACFAQPTPLYDPARSSTFSKVPCRSAPCESLPSAFRGCKATGCVYEYRYVVGFTADYLAAEELAVDGASFPGVVFGCSTANGGDMDSTSGIVGLGRGPLSLVSQLGISRFSYCLRSDSAAGESTMLFGSLANLTGSSNVQSTPFLRNPVAAERAPGYYVNLTGVTVGAADLAVTSRTFSFTPAGGGGGTIVDSGTTFTNLAEAGYAMLREAFLSQVARATSNNLTRVSGARFGFDLCFGLASGEGADAGDVPMPVPRLVLRFESGAEYVVPRRSCFDAVDEEGRVACLLVLPTTTGVSIIGNVMQMDLHVLYDLAGEVFSFAPADCNSV